NDTVSASEYTIRNPARRRFRIKATVSDDVGFSALLPPLRWVSALGCDSRAQSSPAACCPYAERCERPLNKPFPLYFANVGRRMKNSGYASESLYNRGRRRSSEFSSRTY